MSAVDLAVKTKPARKMAKASKLAARPILEDDRIYRIPEVAAVANCAVPTVWRAIYSQHLKTYRVGRYRRVAGAQIRAWLEAGGKTSK